MKTRKGKASYKLPPFGEILSVFHRDEQGRVLTLMPSSSAAFTKARGTPRSFTVIEDHLYLSPVPDKSGTVFVRFYPPAQEI